MRRVSVWVAAWVVFATAGVLAVPHATDEALRAYDAKLVESLRVKDPAASELFREANEARNANNAARAIELYGQVIARAPDFVPAIRRLGTTLVGSGRRAEGIAACRKALSAEDSGENDQALAYALSTSHPNQTPTPEELDEARTLALRAVEKQPHDVFAAATLCQVALARRDLSLLEQGVPRLEALAPNDVGTHFLRFVLLSSTHRLAEARDELERARAAGLPQEQYNRLSSELNSLTPWPERIWKPALVVLAVWIVGAAGLVVLGGALSRATLRAATEMPPTPEGSTQGATLRKVYRTVLAACCVYYFLSLPIVLAMVVVGGGAMIYGFLMIGQIPIKLVLIVVIVVVVTVFSALRSLFIRVKDTDPGERLDLSKEPSLVSVLAEVAAKVGTRPVDNVYFTPGTGVAVMERGGLLRKMRGRTERCLIVGAGALEGLRISPFKAVLAHEYGHFSNRDTAGGGLALAVRRSVLVMATQMARGGAATWYNPAWWFLRGFHRLFLLISQGASRLQEILADRWAAFSYGSKAFEEGLRHVVARSVQFDAHVNATIEEATKGAGVLSNLYGLKPSKPPEPGEIEQLVRKALEREPSLYDSHPSPRDRIRWVQALNAKGEWGGGSGDEDAWSLFSNRGAIERSMTERVRENLHASHGILLKP